MTEPATPTGKRLYAYLDATDDSHRDDILAIEAEAAAAVWDGVKGEHVHLFDPEQGDWCRDCAQRAAAAERERIVGEMRDALDMMPDPDPSPSRDSLSWRAARAAVEGIIKLVEAPSDD